MGHDTNFFGTNSHIAEFLEVSSYLIDLKWVEPAGAVRP